jgi:hypothetical protein
MASIVDYSKPRSFEMLSDSEGTWIHSYRLTRKYQVFTALGGPWTDQLSSRFMAVVFAPTWLVLRSLVLSTVSERRPTELDMSDLLEKGFTLDFRPFTFRTAGRSSHRYIGPRDAHCPLASPL